MLMRTILKTKQLRRVRVRTLKVGGAASGINGSDSSEAQPVISTLTKEMPELTNAKRQDKLPGKRRTFTHGIDYFMSRRDSACALPRQDLKIQKTKNY